MIVKPLDLLTTLWIVVHLTNPIPEEFSISHI
jgi:hypothetical protein